MKNLAALLCNPSEAQIQKSHTSGTLMNSEADIAATAAAIRKFISHYGIDHQDPDASIGTMFGLQKLKDFIAAIDKYNNDPSVSEEQKVDAIRIYRARSAYKDPSTTDPAIEVDEVVIVPTQKNDSDSFEVFPLTAPEVFILGKGTPCPNLCKKYFFVEE